MIGFNITERIRLTLHRSRFIIFPGIAG